MEKITVNHFVNRELKPITENNKKKYPVYVQVIVLTKNLKFKSGNSFFEYMSEQDIKNEMVLSVLEDEKNTIERIVSDLISKEKTELITSKILSQYSKNLINVIENNFCKMLLSEREKTKKFIPNILLSASYSDINEIVFFYNDHTPIVQISEDLHACYNAAHVIYENKSTHKFCVYDLFFGSKQEVIIECFNFYTGDQETETAEMLKAIQNLSVL